MGVIMIFIGEIITSAGIHVLNVIKSDSNCLNSIKDAHSLDYLL